MWKKIIVTGAAAVLAMAALPATAAAEEIPSNYFTLRFGRFMPTGDVKDAGYEGAENGDFVLGRYFGRYFVLEGGFGIMHSEGAESEPYSQIYEDRDITIRGFHLTPKFVYPAGGFEFYGGVGVGRWQIENDVWVRGGSGNVEVKDTVWGYHLVAGINHGFTRYWYLGLEAKELKFLDYLDVDDIAGRSVSLSIGLRF
jgi:outer membrane protein W